MIRRLLGSTPTSPTRTFWIGLIANTSIFLIADRAASYHAGVAVDPIWGILAPVLGCLGIYWAVDLLANHPMTIDVRLRDDKP